jgi:hypothetical protein
VVASHTSPDDEPFVEVRAAGYAVGYVAGERLGEVPAGLAVVPDAFHPAVAERAADPSGKWPEGLAVTVKIFSR